MNTNANARRQMIGGCMRKAVFLVAFLFLYAPIPCFPKNHAPLSKKVLSAKTVYVENHGSAKGGDKAVQELKNWGRWVIVEDRSKADLVLVLTSQEGESSTGHTQTYDPTPAPGMGGAGTWKYGTTTSSSAGSEHLELVDPKTGDSIYSDTQVSVRRTITGLRKRIEEEEKPSKRK